MNRISWDELHFTSSVLWAQRSLDPSSQVGCAIVTQDNIPVSYGYNGPPRNIELTEEQWNIKDFKYMMVEHGERNAIYNSLKTNARVPGSKMYITAPACTDCARAIIQAGIKDLYILNSTFSIWMNHPAWIGKLQTSLDMFKLGGVNCQIIDAAVWGDFTIRVSGKLYKFSGTSVNEYNNSTSG